jgi:hypothetical protein
MDENPYRAPEIVEPAARRGGVSAIYGVLTFGGLLACFSSLGLLGILHALIQNAWIGYSEPLNFVILSLSALSFLSVLAAILGNVAWVAAKVVSRLRARSKSA